MTAEVCVRVRDDKRVNGKVRADAVAALGLLGFESSCPVPS
jgi:hypothetical protein